MGYTAPGVYVNYSANPRIIALGEQVRVPAVVGLGPTTIYVTDEALQRTSGSGTSSKDRLANAGATTTITVNNLPGAKGTTFTSGSAAANYQLMYDSTGAYLTWTSGAGYPAESSIYYASYAYTVPTTQYDVKTFTSTTDILAYYGAENTSSGSVAIGANMALENGAPAVIAVQALGSAYNEVNFKAAIDKLEKKKNIAFVVPMTTEAAIRSYALQHAIKMSSSSYNLERSTVVGIASGTDRDTCINTAQSIRNSRQTLCEVGTGFTRKDAAGNTMTLDASYAAAQVAGAQCGMEKIIQPITGKILVGASLTDDQYTQYEKTRFGANGVCLLTSENGVVKSFHAVTTDPTSADTAEICVRQGIDYVQSQTRTSLNNMYMGKGIVIDATTPTDIEESIKSIWITMVRDGWLSEYGTIDDPTTGQRKVRALQDTAEPRKIRVTGAVKLLYPLVWINVDFTTYV
jgi:hypothetical protein